MALQTADRVRVLTSTTGTGTPTLGSAVAKFMSPSEAGMVNGLTYTYLIEEGNDFEIGLGTYNSSTPSLSRDTVIKSKISGTAGTTKMTLAGSATVSVILSAADLALVEMNRALTLTMLQVADNSNLPIYTDKRFVDHFDILTYVDTAGATNLNSSSAGVLKPTSSALTLITAATGTIISSGMNSGGGTGAAFDSNLSQAVGACARGTSTGALGKDWGSGNTKTITGLKIYAPNNQSISGDNGGTVTYTLRGSNTAPSNYASDGTSLKTGNVPNTNGASGLQINLGPADGITTTTAYRYHWVYMTSSANELDVCEIEFYEGSGTINNVTVNSTTITAAATVTAMSGTILVEENVAATAGTDYTLEFSANAGTNWTQATLTEIMTLITADGNIRVVEAAEIALSNSGTSLRWRLKSLNNKDVEFHGISMRYN